MLITELKEVINSLESLSEEEQRVIAGVLANELQTVQGNRDRLLAFSGALTDEEAAEIRESIYNEFNTIEGEW